MIRIMLVDDQAIVREGLRAMLSLEPDMSVVEEVGGGREALERLEAAHPDVVLLDVRMPGMDGLETLERIKERAPQVSVIMVTLYDDFDYLLRAVSSGAAGYILKDARRAELIRAVRITAEGGAIISPDMLPQLLERMGQMMSGRLLPGGDISPAECPLSERELQVVRLVAEGCTNQEIADELFLSPATIKTHLQNIFQKLQVSDRTQAAVYALRCGLIE